MQGNRESPRLYNESRYLAAPPPSTIGGSEGDQRIVGGTVAEEGEFPWAVALSLGKLLNRALWYNLFACQLLLLLTRSFTLSLSALAQGHAPEYVYLIVIHYS